MEENIELGSVQKTLLLPLWGRAVETLRPKPLMTDNQAVTIMKSIPYDFSRIASKLSMISQASWIARSIWFDEKIKAFIGEHPDATVVNIGCGLDTTFHRVDNGRIEWIDLDLPDVIALRKQYLPEQERSRCVAGSVFDSGWYRTVKNNNGVMLLIAGVIYYFEESEIKRLFSDIHSFLPGAEMVIDYSSRRGIRMANRMVLDRGGMESSSYLKWGIDDIHEIESWDRNIHVLESVPMFREHKKRYPPVKRIGMSVSDAMKIMSLAHIRIE